MSIFKKEELEEQKKELTSLNKQKNLNVRTRKKKEVQKPWSKKERLIVFTTFLVTVVITTVLFFSSRSWKLPNFPRIEVPKFQFLKSETVSLGGNNIQKEKEDLITDYFIRETDKLTGTYSFFVIDLDTNHEFGFRERNVMQAASLIKLPVFTAVYKEVENNRLDLEDIYILKNTDKRSGSGSLQYKDPGYRISYKDMLSFMGKQSDNTAFNIFVNLLGEDKVQKVINDIGMQSTSLAENETTAYDISLFYKKLFNGEIVNKKYADEVLSFITDTIYEDYIPKGITEVKVAHKFGREVNVTNDAGIVFSENPFVLTILSEGIIYSEGDIFIPEFSRFVFDTLK